MENLYDLIILGGGPASMSASIYAKQMGLNTLLIEKAAFGGQVATTSTITNYLGFPVITGEELSQKMREHTVSSGTDIVEAEITNTELGNTLKTVYTHNEKYTAKTVIIGIGTTARALGIDNEKQYLNKGISYSTLRDRDKYADKVVTVVGGGNSAIEDAIYLSEKCKKVHLIHRRQEFRGDSQLVEQLYNLVSAGKIELHLDCKPHSVSGNETVEKFNITHIPTGDIQTIITDCIFVAIGRGADTDIIDKNIERDAQGYIVTNELMQTNLSGVFAVGDIRTTPFRQIVTAVADGAIASLSAFKYIKELSSKN